MNTNYKKGFTLIELLVVIAIIGLLTSVVLASLNSARERAADTSVKSNLATVRSQAELYFDENNSYVGIFEVSMIGVTPPASEAFGAAAASGGGTIGSIQGAFYGESPDRWIALVRLKTSNNFWCVDNTGFAGEVDLDSSIHATAFNVNSPPTCSQI